MSISLYLIGILSDYRIAFSILILTFIAWIFLSEKIVGVSYESRSQCDGGTGGGGKRYKKIQYKKYTLLTKKIVFFIFIFSILVAYVIVALSQYDYAILNFINLIASIFGIITTFGMAFSRKAIDYEEIRKEKYEENMLIELFKLVDVIFVRSASGSSIKLLLAKNLPGQLMDLALHSVYFERSFAVGDIVKMPLFCAKILSEQDIVRLK